jgi:plastocyanin
VALGDAPPKPYSVKMTGTPGRYRFLCSLHPGMKLDVTVKARGARVPSARDDARAAKAQYAAAIKRVKRLAAAKSASATTVKAGNDEGTIAFFGFRNAKPKIKAGQSVTFTMSRESTEIHNVAFGPADFLQALSQRFITPVPAPAGPPTLVLAPEVVFPSDPPGAPVAVDGTNHGNGFFNTGILDTEQALADAEQGGPCASPRPGPTASSATSTPHARQVTVTRESLVAPRERAGA